MDALLAASAPEAPQAPRDRSKPVANVERPVASFARPASPRRNPGGVAPQNPRRPRAGAHALLVVQRALRGDAHRLERRRRAHRHRGPAAFAEEICPKFFRHKNWTSFSRLLNMYEFHKIPAPPALTPLVEFKHPDFRRDSGGATSGRSRAQEVAVRRDGRRSYAGGAPPPKVARRRLAAPGVADLEAEVASLGSENALLRRTSAAAAEMILFSRDGVSRDGSGSPAAPAAHEPEEAAAPKPLTGRAAVALREQQAAARAEEAAEQEDAEATEGSEPDAPRNPSPIPEELAA
ncbi:hypothetical protein SO694_00008591 [Aureococcus anophagefferens]|uniref:HSF-type DNA-binding domain-containing protein n=1 Tax=Aureococcus anophagefferens TaxID=44056 RepID=A0ABR1GDU9_AURAN